MSAFPPDLLAQIQHDWARQDYGRALSRMEERWRSAPRDPLLRLHYATILGHCSLFHEAKTQLDELVSTATPGRRLWALGSAGVASCEFRRYDWAADYMREAAFEPGPPAEVFYRWAQSLERLNRLPEAAEALAEGRARFPEHPGLMIVDARVARRTDAAEQAERLARAVVAMREIAPEHRCEAGYELGHALDAQDRCVEAYAAFAAAKEIQQPHAASFEHAWRARMQQMRSQENLPTAEDFRRWRDESPVGARRHAFLVGCPRSGTTLVERMLGSHPQIAASPESTVWHSAVWMPLLNELGAISSMPAALDGMTRPQIEAARERYWGAIGQSVDGEIGKRVLLDKNPSIFPVLSGAARLFPSTRLIVTLRDPRDIVWSSFTQYLPVNPATAAFVRLESAAEQVSTELSQWFALRERLATAWLEVRYEELVCEPEAELRRAASFLGLPWSEELLGFHKRRDLIRSPTYAAAAEPVSVNAVGRWRRYAVLIKPLESRLKEIVQKTEKSHECERIQYCA